MERTFKESWIVDLIRDPSLAIYVVFGAELDDFQSALFKLQWFTPITIDSSGVNSGKTERAFFFAALRCILLPNDPHLPRIVSIYYQNINTAREVFWPKFEKYLDKSWIFREQFAGVRRGKAIGDFSREGVLVRKFKNGAEIQLPAGNFQQDASSQAGRRFHDLLIDEFPEIDQTSEGLNKQLIARANAANVNKHHPIWANHILLLGHAQDMLAHKSYRRIRDQRKMIHDGSQDHALLTSCFRDFSERFDHLIDFRTARMQKVSLSRGEFDQIWHGIWSLGGANWYSAEAIAASVDPETRPLMRRPDGPEDEGLVYSLGWDTAPSDTPKSDWSAGVVLRARFVRLAAEPEIGLLFVQGRLYRVEPVHAVFLHGRTARQCGGVVHALHRAFSPSLITLDKGGGGAFVYQAAREPTQLIGNQEVLTGGLCTVEDSAAWPSARPLITFHKRGSLELRRVWGSEFLTSDEGINEAGHRQLRKAIDERAIRWPRKMADWPARELAALTPEERSVGEAIDAVAEQLSQIQVVLGADGSPAITKSGFLRFDSKRKKDGAMALMYAFMGLLSCLTSDTGGDEEAEF